MLCRMNSAMVLRALLPRLRCLATPLFACRGMQAANGHCISRLWIWAHGVHNSVLPWAAVSYRWWLGGRVPIHMFARHSCKHIMVSFCKCIRVLFLILHLHVFAPAPAHCHCESVLRHHGAACFSKAPGEPSLRQRLSQQLPLPVAGGEKVTPSSSPPPVLTHNHTICMRGAWA